MNSASAAAQNADGAQIYRDTCSVCHDSGAGQAPRLQDTRDWQMRAQRGLDALYQTALLGKPNSAMAAKGGFVHLSEVQVKAAFDHMMVQTGVTTAMPKPISNARSQQQGTPTLAQRASLPPPTANPLALSQHIAELLRAALGQPQNLIETYEGVVTLRGVGIKISNAMGEITLAGSVEKSEWVQQAHDIASQVPGVSGVINRLVAASLLEWD
jgi:cytochrome c5